ncbi:MAG: hypothetical protein Q8S27_13855 [Hoeflea sp.]|nr:hypothetical protein [Hoeflea sp.]
MGPGKHFISRLVQALLFVCVAAVLTACAGRPKPLDATIPFTVTEVRVTTQSMTDSGFADRLQQKLDATAGRATASAGLASILTIVVLDRSAETGQGWFFNASSRSATLDIAVIDAATGQVLRSSVVRASTATRNGQAADTLLIDRLAADIRTLLGLSGAPPYPVGGIKRAVAWPELKPETMDTNDLDEAARLADPLLNGTVTPTTTSLDLAPKAAPALDLSRPLLTPDPAEEPLPEQAIAPVAPVKPVNMPKTFELPATAPTIVADPAPAPSATGDEPCIITLDNDCSDPDGR